MANIIDVLQEFAPIAHWTVFPASAILSDGDCIPPFIAWTYQQPSEALAKLLHEAVRTFQGEMAWELLTHDRRWILAPARIRQYEDLHHCVGSLAAAGKLKIEDPDFGKRANIELRLLADHIHGRLTQG